ARASKRQIRSSPFPVELLAFDEMAEKVARRIRVLHVIDSFDLGGAQEALVNLVAFGDRERFDIEVACMHRTGVYEKRFRDLGVRTHSLSPHKFFPIYVFKLAWLIARRRY